MDQAKTPLYDALARHWARRPVSFHVPGHKYGALFPPQATEFFAPLLALDATEIGGLTICIIRNRLSLRRSHWRLNCMGLLRHFSLSTGQQRAI